jgi:(hydroxyamino)benzene mutase
MAVIADAECGRRLAWHGVLLFLLGLVVGMAVTSMANPRMGLSTHVGTVLNGVFLIALGAAWGGVTLSARVQRAAFWLLIVGSYGGCLGLLLAAVLNTHDATPIYGAAARASQWREQLVTLTLTIPGIFIVAGTGIVLYGLRRTARE